MASLKCHKVSYPLTHWSHGYLNQIWNNIYFEIALRWLSLDLTDDKPTLVQVMAWCRQATSHYLNQCWLRSMSPCSSTMPQWVNESELCCWWPLQPQWWLCRNGSLKLDPKMPIHCSEPRHYLNQHWLIVNRTPLITLQWNFNQNHTQVFSQENAFKMLSANRQPFCQVPACYLIYLGHNWRQQLCLYSVTISHLAT